MLTPSDQSSQPRSAPSLIHHHAVWYTLAVLVLAGGVALVAAPYLQIPTPSQPMPKASPAPTPTSVNLTDDEIIDRVRNGPAFPEGFYTEQHPYGFSLYYVSESVVLNDTPGYSQGYRRTVCTDDPKRAAELAEQSDRESSVHRALESARETEKYFEFVRIEKGRPRERFLERVDKCGYLDRTKEWGSFWGTFNLRPMTKVKVKELIEYLTYYRTYQSAGSMIVSSKTREDQRAFTHTVVRTEAVYGDWSKGCEISVVAHTFRIDKRTGDITAADPAALRRISADDCRPSDSDVLKLPTAEEIAAMPQIDACFEQSAVEGKVIPGNTTTHRLDILTRAEPHQVGIVIEGLPANKAFVQIYPSPDYTLPATLYLLTTEADADVTYQGILTIKNARPQDRCATAIPVTVKVAWPTGAAEVDGFARPVDRILEDDASGTEYTQGELIVMVGFDTPAREVDALAKKFKAKVVGGDGPLGMYQLRFGDQDLVELQEIADRIEKEYPGYRAMPNYLDQTSY